MKTNVKTPVVKVMTHEGAPAKSINDELQLRRTLMACMLWEGTFYEDGVEIANRIAGLVKKVDPLKVFEMAIEARTKFKLRHAPLLVAREAARLSTHKSMVGELLPAVIRRADELSEFLAIYWKDKKQPLSKQVKIGLAKAFANFDEYQLAKYNRDAKVHLRDVMFLVHPRPVGGMGNTKANRKVGQFDPAGELYRKLASGELETPDTWEVALSAGKDKKESFERLLAEKKLGALALLRNLRNMKEAGVNEEVIFSALENMNVERVLPFRFITAARYAPQWESRIEKAMLKCLAGQKQLPGKTVLLIDVSGSMDQTMSEKSELDRIDAACGLAILARELCENVAVYTFSNSTKRVPDRHGFALRDAIQNSQSHMGTMLWSAIEHIDAHEKYDRMIVLTDEQSHEAVGSPAQHGYLINVATYKNGVGYGGKWTHIDGFSEAVFDYIAASEGVVLVEQVGEVVDEARD